MAVDRASRRRAPDAGRPRGHRCYGTPPPGLDPEQLGGYLIVVEGPDGSGRTTQLAFLRPWLEANGYAVVDVGLRRSRLVAPEISRAMELNVLGPTTMSLFYATDFFDQLDDKIVPALRSGFVVLADRYIYSLIARAAVRGLRRAWLRRLYSPAVVPDAIFYLKTSPEVLLDRVFRKAHSLDYWESGRDIGLSTDLLQSFLQYQAVLQSEFLRMERLYGFTIVDGDRSIAGVNQDLRRGIARLLGIPVGSMPRLATPPPP